MQILNFCIFTLICSEPRLNIFFKRQSKPPALILFDCDIMQKFHFSDEVPGWGSSLFFKIACSVDCQYFLFLSLRISEIRANRYIMLFFSFLYFTPSHGQCHRAHQWGSPWLKGCARTLTFKHFRGDSSSFSFSSSFCCLSSLVWYSYPSVETNIHGYPIALLLL